MKIALVEPFYSGSHKMWADQLKTHSSHDIKLITLPGRHWKWRMQSAAPLLASKANDLKSVDLFICTDMINLPEFRAFLDPSKRSIPIYLYMHENQITYPWSPQDQDVELERDHTYGIINLKSCLNADRIFFNSHYHLNSFFNALPSFLEKFPDDFFSQELGVLRNKSHVLYLGLELPTSFSTSIEDPPTILWNHRWEFDKNPNSFFNTLFRLQKKGIEFELIVCGARGRRSPDIFNKARNRLKKQIIHWGFAESKADYISLLKRSDILPVSSYQDFFGISVIEAIACGVYPLLPDRLAYTEHIPTELQKDHLYKDETELYEKLLEYLQHPALPSSSLIEYVQKYSWPQLIMKYDNLLAALPNE